VSRLGTVLFARDSFDVLVEQPSAAVIARLQSAIVSAPAVPRSRAPVYRGEFSESGFVLRRVAAHPKDTSASVVARGRVEPDVRGTRMHVTVRHSRWMVVLGWLLALLACGNAVATIQSADSRMLAAAGILAAFAVVWQWTLWRNVRQVSSDIRALLTTAAQAESGDKQPQT
jgi:hypothetical protein